MTKSNGVLFMKNQKIIFVIFFYIITSLIYGNVNAKCDYSVTGGVKAKYKKFGNIGDATIVKIIYIDDNDNLINGNLCSFDENGNLNMEINCVDGVQQGISKSYYANGKIRWTSNYVDGVVDGKNETFNEDGTPDKILNYRNGIVYSGKCANGYNWTQYEINMWNGTNQQRDLVRNICRKYK